MEDLLIAILQGLLEFLWEVITYWFFDWPFCAPKWQDRETVSWACFTLFVVGGGLGWLSILVFPHTLITHPWARITNLVVAPITSAFLSRVLARVNFTNSLTVDPRKRFWQAFWFTLGLTAVRFAFATRR